MKKWEVSTWCRRKRGTGEKRREKGKGMQKQIFSKFKLDQYIMLPLWSETRGNAVILTTTLMLRPLCPPAVADQKE